MPTVLGPYKWLIYAAIAAAALGAAWRIHHNIKESGREEIRAEVAAERVELVDENSRREAELQSNADDSTKEKDEQIRRINRQLVATLGELRKRSDVRTSDLPSTAGTCEGATGANLSERDAAFLAGYHSRARTLLAERDDCYRRYDAARNAQPQPATP